MIVVVTNTTTLTDPVTINITYPQAGYHLENSGAKDGGSIANIQWNEQNGDYPVSIFLFDQNDRLVRTIATNVQDTGSYMWRYDPTLTDGTYQIRIDVLFPPGGVPKTQNPAYHSAYSGFFTVSNSPASQTPSITVLSPNGGEMWRRGATQTINWYIHNKPEGFGSILVHLLSADGQRAYTIGSFAGNVVGYGWAVGQVTDSTPPPDGQYRLRVYGLDNAGTVVASDDSDTLFSITTSTGY